MATEVVLTGEFLCLDKDRYKDKESGEMRETMVLVFEGDSPRYPEIVKVGKEHADSVKKALDGYEGSSVSVRVFAGRYGGLWFKCFADDRVA